MNRHVNAIAGRLSLRAPQRRSLELLDRVTEIAPPRKDADVAVALATIRGEFPSVQDFEREFPSLCFALATGVGKTRLMGAFISYLHLAHGIHNFFVLAPNLTIYNKLIADFTPNTPKYVFKGIAEFAINAPQVITGDSYEQHNAAAGSLFGEVRINIFNISKINSEVRGGKAPRIKRLSEYIGQSYFDYLAGLPDLVLLMDESHRYRASAGVRAINELKPILGLELTATPFVESGGARGAAAFQNVIYDYPLSQAMADGFVKEPAVVTRKNFNPAGMGAEEIERLKLEDGIRLHESVKVELETYARESGERVVKPFLLIIARDTTHAAALLGLVQSDTFFEGRYQGKAIQVDSSKSGAEEEEMIGRLLKVESTEEPTEIVIHVNMLKEGWDVTNLYTIVPLRAAHARVLIEQSIGRGLRLPYGKRTGVTAVDRLNIVAHDRFQEIVDEANKPDSTIRLQSVVLDMEALAQKTRTVVSDALIQQALGAVQPTATLPTTDVAASSQPPAFTQPAEQSIAQQAYAVIRSLGSQPQAVPTSAHLKQPEVQARIVAAVQAQQPKQLELEATTLPDIAAIVAKTVDLVTQKTIDIPRILVVPKGEVKSGFRPFALDLSSLRYPPVDEELWIQTLRTRELEVLALGRGGIEEERIEDYVVSGLVDFDDVSYDEHADLLYDLAGQTVRHFQAYLSEDEARKVLRCYQRPIAKLIHAQMQAHHWEEADAGYEVKVSQGYSDLKPSAYTCSVNEPPADYRIAPADKSNMARLVFGGFSRCLYGVQKFDSEAERKLAVILEREALRWFKPAKGQFQIFYKNGADPAEYLPDFVAETADSILMLEPKARNELDDPIVIAKKEAAVQWCRNASLHTAAHGGKPWRYGLIPHDEIAENMTLSGLVARYCT